MTRELLEGADAIAAAMVAADCRFFAGYPMTPFTEVLEGMARRLPEVGGVCMNAESEIEAIGMAWGAAATGARAATGSVGQGLSLMQESLAEMSLAGVPLVVLNMSRGQADYWQATRGGGHGDYRHIVLAPQDVPEAVSIVPRAFDLADRWRTPVLIYGDYFLAHTVVAVDIAAGASRPADKPWALTGATGGSGQAKLLSPLGTTKRRDDVGYDLAVHYRERADATAAMVSGTPAEAETRYCDDADLVVVAFGTAAKFLLPAIEQLRAEGHRVGLVRPITLFPFPAEAIRAAASGADAIAVYENNEGQMVDDVRLAVLGDVPVHFIGRLSLDSAGFGIAPDYNVETLAARVASVLPRTVGGSR